MEFNKDNFDKVLETLDRGLVFEYDHAVITGSFALCCYGLLNEFDDVDLVVMEPDSPSMNAFILLYKESGSTKEAEEETYESLNIKVRVGDLIVNLLGDRFMEEPPFLRLGNTKLMLDPLSNILRAKMELNRPKDQMAFEQMDKRLQHLSHQPDFTDLISEIHKED